MTDTKKGITFKVSLTRPQEAVIQIETYGVNLPIRGIPTEEMADNIASDLASYIPRCVKQNGGQVNMDGSPIMPPPTSKELEQEDKRPMPKTRKTKEKVDRIR